MKEIDGILYFDQGMTKEGFPRNSLMVCYRNAPGNWGVSPFYHKVLVYTDNDGNMQYIRGGPENDYSDAILVS
jgi:hypothetical protein